jgi:hypothetical protein
VETAEPSTVNFITDMIYQAANGHDGNIHDEIILGNEQLGLTPGKLFVDSSYLSGELIKQYSDCGQELMGYMQGYAGREEAFQNEAFDIEFENQIAICPAGHQNEKARVEKSGFVNLYFASETCQLCPKNRKISPGDASPSASRRYNQRGYTVPRSSIRPLPRRRRPPVPILSNRGSNKRETVNEDNPQNGRTDEYDESSIKGQSYRRSGSQHSCPFPKAAFIWPRILCYISSKTRIFQ